MSFYQVPKFIFDPIGKTGICENSTILLPSDFTGGLAEQIKSYKPDGIIQNKKFDNIQDYEWWESLKGKVDWVIAITQGTGEATSWVTECGLSIANKGICVLDRLTFLEPTRKREAFLQESNLVDLKILSPRPSFRADGKQSKDSVTSAWFVFKKSGVARTSTFIEYEVGWLRPKKVLP